MKRIALMALCLLAALGSSASDFEKDGFYYNITSLTDLTVELAKPDNGHYSGDITVPETVEWSSRVFNVTAINPMAFSECNIGTLNIKDNIRNMGRMFWGGIQSLRFGDSETPIELDEDTFQWFWYNSGVKDVYIGRDIHASSGAELFGYGSGAQSVVFGPKVTAIPSGLFSGCSTLKTAEVPDNIKTIGGSSFKETALETFKALGAETIGAGAFRECKKLATAEFSGQLTTIEGYAFEYCTALTTIKLPVDAYGLRVIGYGAFEGCSALKTFSIPQGVIVIGNGAFGYCSNLESINIPASVMDFGNVYNEYDNQRGNVFKDCKSLNTITMGSAIPVASIENNFEFSVYLSATLKVPVGAAEVYRSTDSWMNFLTIEEDASIADDIFVITKSYYDGGIEVIANDALPAYSIDRKDYKFVKKGETVEIKAIPYDGYKLSSLLINGVDVTAEVEDNAYHTTMSDNMIVSATFEYDYTPHPDPDPIFLTIKQADNGSIRQRISKWDSFTFYIEPADGWKLHTVTFNGEDITSDVADDGQLHIYDITDNAELAVSYEQDNAAVSALESSQARVYVSGGAIVVANTESGESIQVYNEAGMNVATRHAMGATESIRVEKGHVYIVKLKGKTVKLSV